MLAWSVHAFKKRFRSLRLSGESLAIFCIIFDKSKLGPKQAPTNEEKLLRKNVSLNVSPFARTQNISCGNVFSFPAETNKQIYF